MRNFFINGTQYFFTNQLCRNLTLWLICYGMVKKFTKSMEYVREDDKNKLKLVFEL